MVQTPSSAAGTASVMSLRFVGAQQSRPDHIGAPLADLEAAALVHLGSIPALWGSGYGRTLLVKLGLLAVVFGTGAYNWRRVRPSLGNDAGTRRLRGSAAVEIAVGVLVLAVTAVLVATAPPIR